MFGQSITVFGQSIKVKALMEKEKNRILFVESDKDFIDILFSFFTMSMGAIIRLTRNLSQTTTIGSLNNLYKSVENLDISCLRTKECKTMLLQPRNGAANQYKDLKLKIDDGEPLCYYSCGFSACKVFSHYKGSICHCGKPMDHYVEVKGTNTGDGGVFVKGQTRLIITDELELMPPSTATSFSIFSKLGLVDASSVEERTFNIGKDEVLNLLKNSLVSSTALTATLLKLQEIPESSNDETFGVESLSIKHEEEEKEEKENGMIRVMLVLSKSKKIVCYAEVDEVFVDLLFSFLTVPLGYIIKEMNGAPSKGCINHLYKSVEVLDDDKYFKSYGLKRTLLCPSILPGFNYVNQLLDLEVVKLTSGAVAVTIKDPKLPPYEEGTSNGGFVAGPAMFTVTDDLIITPISPISAISVLNKLKIPFNDTEERVVHVGKEEALSLLIASFISKSALTDTFVRKIPKQEYY